MRKHLTAINY